MPISEVKSFFSLASEEAAIREDEISEKTTEEENTENIVEETDPQVTPTTSQHSIHPLGESDRCLREGNETVLEILGRDGRFTKFLQKINLNHDFEGDLGDPREEWTIFAPTDKAFSKLQKGHHKYSDERLRKILQYHIIQDVVTEDDFETTPLVSTTLVSSRLDGHPQRLLIESYKNHFYINGVTIKETDLEARNGVVHVINEVILPPNRMTKQLKEISKEFSIFLKAVEKTGLDREFNESGITGFIPTNYAFKGLGRKVLKHLFSSYGIVELRNILLSHLSTSLIYASDLKNLLRRGDLGKKKGRRSDNDYDLPPRRGRRYDPPSRGGRHRWDDDHDRRRGRGHRDENPRRGGRRWDDEPKGRFPPRRGGGRWDDEPEGRPPYGRDRRRWDEEPRGRYPHGRNGRHWDDEPEERYPPRRGGRRWDDEPEERYPPRRGGRRWDDEPEQRYPPRRGGRDWDDEPEERYPPRRGGRGWGDEPEERYPPRRGGRGWDDEPAERHPPRRGGRRWNNGPEEGYPPRRGGGGYWDDDFEHGPSSRRGRYMWSDRTLDFRPRHGDEGAESLGPNHPDDQKSNALGKGAEVYDLHSENCVKYCIDSRRRSDSWDDLKEELANIENHQTKNQEYAVEESSRNDHKCEPEDGLNEEYEETIYEVDFPSKLCGERFELEVFDDEYQDEIEITVNKQARILLADGVAENGVIHIIDSVLLPKGMKLPKMQWHDFQKHSF